MFDEEVLVAPLFKVRIVVFIMSIASLLERFMEVNGIFIVEIRRGEIWDKQVS